MVDILGMYSPLFPVLLFYVSWFNPIHSPGRFLAVHEMKLMFAILLLRYDIRLKPDTKPQPFFIGTMSLPDTKLEVLFKARN